MLFKKRRESGLRIARKFPGSSLRQNMSAAGRRQRILTSAEKVTVSVLYWYEKLRTTVQIWKGSEGCKAFGTFFFCQKFTLRRVALRVTKNRGQKGGFHQPKNEKVGGAKGLEACRRVGAHVGSKGGQ